MWPDVSPLHQRPTPRPRLPPPARFSSQQAKCLQVAPEELARRVYGVLSQAKPLVRPPKARRVVLSPEGEQEEEPAATSWCRGLERGTAKPSTMSEGPKQRKKRKRMEVCPRSQAYKYASQYELLCVGSQLKDSILQRSSSYMAGLSISPTFLLLGRPPWSTLWIPCCTPRSPFSYLCLH